ncbi:MAG: phytanoyl-CoA dioxygenase family protein [Arenicellales bacterium]|jgi:ectoine hydroxylase-related dioxygenase (phytanoyl-CoA dioxygenase family)|nr:phytanoyl-CoA dioxygenase family protein [Arenicellales bacterium]
MTPPLKITAEHCSLFDNQGFFVLESVIPKDQLELLRNLSDQAVAARTGGSTVGTAEGAQLMGTASGRVFIFGLETEQPSMYRALLSDWALKIVGSLTPDASLFHTEFVVKAQDQGDQGTRFGWHQDGGYNTEPSAGGAMVPDMPHISLWCALDDMSVDNGALRVIPFDRNPMDHPIAYTAPPRPGITHQPIYRHQRVTDEKQNINNHVGDVSAYFGNDPGDVMKIGAGSVVVFSALTLHGSGINTTDKPRRALNIAYSQSTISHEAHESSGKSHSHVDFIVGGKLTENAAALRI